MSSRLSEAANLLGLHFLDFALTNLFMILVVSISHGRSCPVLFRTRLLSLVCHMVLPLCSFLTS